MDDQQKKQLILGAAILAAYITFEIYVEHRSKKYIKALNDLELRTMHAYYLADTPEKVDLVTSLFNHEFERIKKAYG